MPWIQSHYVAFYGHVQCPKNIKQQIQKGKEDFYMHKDIAGYPLHISLINPKTQGRLIYCNTLSSCACLIVAKISTPKVKNVNEIKD